ncbi:MAG: polyisoprenoid-binding protein [Legionella longbeachae]|nr:polyisoprenoid-binding protein [Legionella longbeachae]
MKKLFRSFTFLLLPLFIFTSPLYAEPETFILDNNHTYVLWSIDHLGYSTQFGKWYASGQIILDKDNPSQSKVNAKIDVADMVTGIPQLDKHLRGKLFFDTEHYPTATFVSDKVNVLGKNTATVDGILTLHGVSKPVVLQVTLNNLGMNPISNKMTAGFTATTSIKRSDFGINTLLPSLGDTVDIKIGAEAYQDKKVG